jgi:hypothetical protein
MVRPSLGLVTSIVIGMLVAFGCGGDATESNGDASGGSDATGGEAGAGDDAGSGGSNSQGGDAGAGTQGGSGGNSDASGAAGKGGTSGTNSGGNGATGGNSPLPSAREFCNQYQTDCTYGLTNHFANDAACLAGFSTASSERQVYMAIHLDKANQNPTSIHCTHAACLGAGMGNCPP